MDPLPPPACLTRPYPSSQKGGTLIAEDVLDDGAHRARVCDPDGYRPRECANCLHDRLHVHDYRERVRRGELVMPIRVIRYRCASEDCGARWQVLPAFMARHLHRGWGYVERQVGDAPASRREQAPAPARTLRRWRARLRSSARFIVQVLASSGDSVLTRLATELSLRASRLGVVATLGGPFSASAALLHRLVPGARLM